MTQEELQKLYLDLRKCYELGYEINEVIEKDFRNARANGTLDIVLDEIKEKRNVENDIEDFAKNMFASGAEMNNIIKDYKAISDFNPNNISPNWDNFRNEIEELNNIFGDVKDYLTIQNELDILNENIKENEKKLESLNKKRINIDLNNDLSDVAKTFLRVPINTSIDKVMTDNDALRTAKKEKQQKLEISLNDLKNKNINDVEKLTENALGVINKLDAEYQKLQLDNKTSEKLINVIRAARDKVVSVRINMGYKKNEIAKKLEDVGLVDNNKTSEEINEMLKEYDEEIKKLSSELEPVQSGDRIDDILSGVDETFEQEEIKETKIEEVDKLEIKNVSDLVSELKKLNPGLEVSMNEYNQPSISVEKPEDIKLPNGFKYDENLGINNKVNDVTPFMSVEVKPFERKNTADLSQEEKLDVIESEPLKKDEQVKINTSSKVKSGKQKVKKTRHAIIAPYVKTALMFGGIGAGIALLGGLPVVTAAATVGGIVTVLQKCYTKACDAGLVNLPQFKDTVYKEHPEEVMAPVAIGYMVSNKAKVLLNGIKEYKYLRQYGPSKEEPIEKRDVQPEEVEEVAPLEVQPTLSEIEAKRIQNETANDLFNRALGSQVDEELDNLSMGGR